MKIHAHHAQRASRTVHTTHALIKELKPLITLHVRVHYPTPHARGGLRCCVVTCTKQHKQSEIVFEVVRLMAQAVGNDASGQEVAAAAHSALHLHLPRKPRQCPASDCMLHEVV